MKKLLSLGMTAALLVVTSAAFAYPTLYGPTGVVGTPTAEVVPAGQFSIAADWYDTEGDSSIPVRLNYGIANNFEVGVLYSFDKFSFGMTDGETLVAIDTDNTWGVNAKYKTPFTLGDAAWSLGAAYSKTAFDGLITDGTTPLLFDGDITTTQVYFAGTKTFVTGEDEASPAITGTLGVNWTSEKVAIDAEGVTEPDSESAFRFFANLGVTFSNNLTVAAEFQTKDEDLFDEFDPISSIVVRYPFTSALTGQVGFTNAIGTYGADDHNVFAGLQYTFGGAADEE